MECFWKVYHRDLQKVTVSYNIYNTECVDKESM